MRWERRGRNVIAAIVLLIVVSSVSYAGLPVTQRIEEYIAFVLTTDFETDMFADQAQQVAAWAEGISWVSDLGVLWHRLETLVTPPRKMTQDAAHDRNDSGDASGWDER